MVARHRVYFIVIVTILINNNNNTKLQYLYLMLLLYTWLLIHSFFSFFVSSGCNKRGGRRRWWWYITSSALCSDVNQALIVSSPGLSRKQHLTCSSKKLFVNAFVDVRLWRLSRCARRMPSKRFASDRFFDIHEPCSFIQSQPAVQTHGLVFVVIGFSFFL